MTSKLSDSNALDMLTSANKHDSLRGNRILSMSSVQSSGDRQDKSSLRGTSTATQMVDDTVHYLSPASASPISMHTLDDGEGGIPPGYIYKSPSFMRFLHAYKPGEISYASSSTISCIEPELQRTLAIVKPEAMEYEDVIVRRVVEAGFAIIRKRYIHLTPEQVSEIYSQHYGSPGFPHMVVSVSIGPILSLCMMAVNAVQKWKDLVGPDHALKAEWFYPMSMRVRFGLVDDIPDVLHASETLPESTKENRYFNPESVVEPIIQEEDKVTDYLNLYVNPTLVDGLTDVVRVKPIDPILHLADYVLKHNPYQPRFPEDISLLPT